MSAAKLQVKKHPTMELAINRQVTTPLKKQQTLQQKVPQFAIVVKVEVYFYQAQYKLSAF